MALTQLKTGAIADDAVTTDKLANAINTERTANTAKSTNATHTGEVTGSGALTITADAVTGAKIADDAIDSEHYADGSIDTAHIADNQITLAKMAGGTDGQIITYDASGDPVAVGPGTDGQVLTSTGAGSPPAFEDAGGGRFGAYATHNSTTSYTFTTNTWQDAVHSATITPTKAGSKILILLSTYFKNAAQPDHGVHGQIKLFRQVASGSETEFFFNTHSRSVYTNGYSGTRIEGYGPGDPTHYIDSPTYTLGDAIIYTVDVGYQGNVGSPDAVYWNGSNDSTLTVLELLA